MIHVTGRETWPSRRALEVAINADPILSQLEGSLKWGQSPCDKLTAIERMRVAGIPVPNWTKDVGAAEALTRRGEKWWGRKLKHTQGLDIARTPFTKRWRTRDYWVRVIPDVTQEFRVHTFLGRAFRTGAKLFTLDGQDLPPGAAPHDAPKVRSDRNGWLLTYSQDKMNRYTTKVERDAVRGTVEGAVRALGLDTAVFCAVDCLMTKDGVTHVLEVNTAPALGDHTLASYLSRLRLTHKRGEWPTPAQAAPTQMKVEDDEEYEDEE